MAYFVGKCQLQVLLDRNGISQQELAKRLGITRQQVNKYSRDKTVMSYQVAYNIAEILGCNMSELYQMELSYNE